MLLFLNPLNSEEVRIKSPLTTPLLKVTSYNYIFTFSVELLPIFTNWICFMYVYDARDSATFFFLPRSNSTHYHKRDLPLITQTNVGLLSLHFQLRRKAKSWLKMLSLLDILPTAGFEFQVISFTWPGSTELVGSNKCFLVLQFHVQKNCMYFVTKIVLTYCEKKLF